MKVFPDADGGATEASILNALEDTAVLGADVVNLSLGSDNGFAAGNRGVFIRERRQRGAYAVRLPAHYVRL